MFLTRILLDICFFVTALFLAVFDSLKWTIPLLIKLINYGTHSRQQSQKLANLAITYKWNDLFEFKDLEACLWICIWIHRSDKGFKSQHEFVPWLRRRFCNWKGLQYGWLVLCPLQTRELVQLDVDLKLPGPTHSWYKLKPTYEKLLYRHREDKLFTQLEVKQFLDTAAYVMLWVKTF